ncbi:hypothetical protein [Streptomyces sp. NTK 937]|uniref:hypothetical protein n=1 Tax=Streptomyces sp. NTK 937 TaxID=1487711 RepID=UPI0004A929FC|nr:hypothetical protein [Streptomyces sp. NTK 937]KDQ65724.1 hypothetical protein DT87_00260 [Streptomyces sp. NTK 937]
MADIEHHARAIEAAIWAARKDGFELCDDDGVIIWRGELWEIRNGQTTDDFRTIQFPTESLEDAPN